MQVTQALVHQQPRMVGIEREECIVNLVGFLVFPTASEFVGSCQILEVRFAARLRLDPHINGGGNTQEENQIRQQHTLRDARGAGITHKPAIDRITVHDQQEVDWNTV